MTKDTPPMQGIAWEPTTEGIELTFNLSNKKIKLPMPDVRELAADMEEANMLARGYERHDNIEMHKVEQFDVVLVAGVALKISSVMSAKFSGVDKTVLQTIDEDEVTLDSHRLVTVYRRVE